MFPFAYGFICTLEPNVCRPVDFEESVFQLTMSKYKSLQRIGFWQIFFFFFFKPWTFLKCVKFLKIFIVHHGPLSLSNLLCFILILWSNCVICHIGSPNEHWSILFAPSELSLTYQYILLFSVKNFQMFIATKLFPVFNFFLKPFEF